MYLQRKQGYTVIWHTNDDLIYGWELRMCKRTKEHYVPGKRRIFGEEHARASHAA